MLSWLLGGNQRKVERARLREMIDFSWKRLREEQDILPQKRADEFAGEIQQAQNALTAGDDHVVKLGERLSGAFQKCFPPRSFPLLREYGDMFFVAIVVAATVQAFFFKPFKIPTGSMQPTLNGITVRAATPQENSWWYRLISRPIFGERVFRFVADTNGELEVRGVTFKTIQFGGGHGFFSIFRTDATELKVGSTTYALPLEYSKFQSEVLPKMKRSFRAGEVILNCVIQTGDQLFVDRFTYNFRKPRRGEVFVFDTSDIPKTRHQGDFYVKRLAGIPGDTLRVEDGDLYINGAKPTEPGFRRVMSKENGYRGYSNTHQLADPSSTMKAGDREYIALGDNSYSSSDSRDWGNVPYHDIVGRGFFVYWPFTRHFGRIE